MGTKPEEITGLGPFKVAEFARNRAVFARNELYWKRDAQGASLPKLERVIWLGAQSNLLGQFKEGKIDLFEPSAEDARALPSTAKLILGGPQTVYIPLFINQDVTDAEKRVLFRDVRFRQAIAHATDRAAFVKQYLGGLAAPRESSLHPLSPFYDEASLVRYPFDLTRAAMLLDQAGLKDADADGWRDLPSKKPFKLTFLLHRDDPVRIEVAKIYQANLAKVNLKVELETTSVGDWRGRLFAKPPRYEAAMATYTIEIFEMPSVIQQLAGLFSSKGEFHIYRPSDAEGRELTEVQKAIDQIVAQLPSAPDALALFARLQKLFSEDVPVLPLYGPQYLLAVQPSVKNAELINAYGYVRFLEFLMPVSTVCEAVGLARSSYYHEKQNEDESELRQAIEAIIREFPTYGSRRAPLQRALAQSRPEIHHSDQGVQYAATAYGELLQAAEVAISMAEIGEPWQNGYAERLMRTIKEEEVQLSEYQDYPDAYRQLGRFLDEVYMRKRIHSSLGYLTPAEFASQWQQTQAEVAFSLKPV